MNSNNCRSCNNHNLKSVIDLGLTPLANNLLNDLNQETEMFPLEMKYCSNCYNCQLSYVVEPEKMFDNYLYVSSTAASFREHFQKAAISYIERFNLTSNDLVVDIGSNDGIALKPLMENNIKVLGIEPAKNVAEIANEKGVNTLNAYFKSEVVDKIVKEYGQAKLVTASNVFAHSDELVNICNESFRLLQDDGSFIVEVQYLLDTINDLTFDNIYHEHVNYWSVTSINNFFKNLGFYVYDIEHINTHGGSIRVFVNKTGNNITENVENFLKKEIEFGITNINTYNEFRSKIEEVKENVIYNFNKLKQKYNRICAYGSPAKATTSLNYFGIDNSYIEYTIEDNELKNNKIIPGVNIPIKNKNYSYENLPDVIIVLAWNFFDYIVKNNQELIKKGVIFINIKDLYKK